MIDKLWKVFLLRLNSHQTSQCWSHQLLPLDMTLRFRSKSFWKQIMNSTTSNTLCPSNHFVFLVLFIVVYTPVAVQSSTLAIFEPYALSFQTNLSVAMPFSHKPSWNHAVPSKPSNVPHLFCSKILLPNIRWLRDCHLQVQYNKRAIPHLLGPCHQIHHCLKSS